MEFGNEFVQGMYPAIREQFAETVLPVVAKRTELQNQLERLNKQLDNYERQLSSELPMRKQAILREVSQGIADGDDVLPLRKKVREIEQEMEEVKEIVATMKTEAIPRTKNKIEETDNAIRDALHEAGAKAREPFFTAVKTVLMNIFEADQAWYDTLQKAAHDSGLSREHLQHTSGFVTRLLPETKHQFKLRLESWQ